MNKVRILGAKTLDKYTEGILVQGFKNNSWGVTDSADKIVYQIHGAPQSGDDDKIILEQIKQSISIYVGSEYIKLFDQLK